MNRLQQVAFYWRIKHALAVTKWFGDPGELAFQHKVVAMVDAGIARGLPWTMSLESQAKHVAQQLRDKQRKESMSKTKRLTPLGYSRRKNKELKQKLSSALSQSSSWKRQYDLSTVAVREHCATIARMRDTLNRIGDHELQLVHLGKQIRHLLKGKPPRLNRDIDEVLRQVGL